MAISPSNPYAWKPPTTEGADKTLLVVEDDRAVLSLYRMGLKGLNGFKVLFAENGAKAVEILRSQTVDVLVTDLNMPVMDGFSLIAQVASDFPAMPIIVMTSMDEQEHHNTPLALGALRIFNKPPHLSKLMEEIRTVAAQEPTGMVKGISLNSLLQLLNWERKNCTLTVKSGAERGHLYIRDGNLIHALYKDKEGLPAAYDILIWQRPTVEFVDTCRVEASIHDLPITEILMNVALIADNQAVEEPTPAPPPPPPAEDLNAPMRPKIDPFAPWTPQ